MPLSFIFIDHLFMEKIKHVSFIFKKSFTIPWRYTPTRRTWPLYFLSFPFFKEKLFFMRPHLITGPEKTFRPQ